MNDPAHQFIAEARRYLSSSYLPKIERCLNALSDEDVWWRPNEESNSIGNLILHLAGSTRMWIVTGVGDIAVQRDRQQEFDERTMISRDDLLALLKETLSEADAVLANFDTTKVLQRRHVRDWNGTVLEAIFHAVEHFSMHAGQIMMLTKMRAGKDLKLYD